MHPNIRALLPECVRFCLPYYTRKPVQCQATSSFSNHVMILCRLMNNVLYLKAG